jgi:hypothetical protein
MSLISVKFQANGEFEGTVWSSELACRHIYGDIRKGKQELLFRLNAPPTDKVIVKTSVCVCVPATTLNLSQLAADDHDGS